MDDQADPHVPILFPGLQTGWDVPGPQCREPGAGAGGPVSWETGSDLLHFPDSALEEDRGGGRPGAVAERGMRRLYTCRSGIFMEGSLCTLCSVM